MMAGCAKEEKTVKRAVFAWEGVEEADEQLLENYTAEDLAAALLKELANDADVQVKITPEKPLPYRGNRRHGGNGHGSHRGDNHGRYGKNARRSRNFDRKGRSGHGSKQGFKIRNRKG